MTPLNDLMEGVAELKLQMFVGKMCRPEILCRSRLALGKMG
jgi:hypothetical protein